MKGGLFCARAQDKRHVPMHDNSKKSELREQVRLSKESLRQAKDRLAEMKREIATLKQLVDKSRQLLNE
jgi:hypothetical protein